MFRHEIRVLATFIHHHFQRFRGCRRADARPKHQRVMAGAVEGDAGEIFVGERAEKFRGILSLKYPMEHGIAGVSDGFRW